MGEENENKSQEKVQVDSNVSFLFVKIDKLIDKRYTMYYICEVNTNTALDIDYQYDLN